MARINLEIENMNDLEVSDIFSELREKVGRVPAAYRAFALHPHILQANWNRTNNILGKGNLPIEVKEAIATRVSKVNGCDFCLNIHKENLVKLGFNSATVESIANGESSDQRLDLVLKFVSTATKDPHYLNDSDFNALKKSGYSERNILEILTVMEMYTGYNKIIVALDLQPDD
ncbi:carboxymuconolactone decarboxylase family protein [Nitrosomonas sp. Nm34]|uniref:carboxymuconolactone decarboxylase family protein n=1 Tax=Nitrosomonas sp. Nm34 TaxID=1881055 RepID=UPI0008E5EFAA|nr:carboxymuconolactone decarboxylase family protein [Nitrosomonas sp. Nm34]SFI86785.1 uncharacterized peroxidase-related enzyme [Nitrosomonas sp. Nm34]